MGSVSIDSKDLENAKSILEQLVRIRTPQPEGDEKDAALFLQDLFKAYPVERILLDHGGNRASLIVTIPGRDRSRSVAIAGHLDTVGVNPADKWEYAPFSAFFDGERMYGRGSADMKGGVTSIVLTALSLLRDRFCPKTDVQFCFTADEEVGGMGAKALCDGGYLDKATEIVVVKPTGECVGLAEKGALWLSVTAKGRCAHAAIPESGVNAVDQIVSLAQNISAWLGKKGKYRLLGYSTCTITNLHGGLYPNVVPDYAEAFLDIRTSPNIAHTALLKKIQALVEEQMEKNPPLSLDFEVKADRPALGMDENAPLVKRFAQIYEQLRYPWETVGIRYFTDTSVFVPRLGIPFVIIGPGEEIFFHQPDEYISLASVTRIAALLNAYLRTTT